MENLQTMLEHAMNEARFTTERREKVHRFDIFKGIEDSDGKIHKLRSMGAALLLEGAKTYTVYLKTLLKDVFYLLPEQKKLTRGDYVILSREVSQTPGRKYYWNNIGECYLLSGQNSGLMRLSFDLFGVNDIFMSLHPINKEEFTEAVKEIAA